MVRATIKQFVLRDPISVSFKSPFCHQFLLIYFSSRIVRFISLISVFSYQHHHHHHVVPLAWISLTLSRHISLSFIASGRSSGLHPVSSHSCWMYVQAGRPAFAQPYEGVHRSKTLMSSSMLLQQCPACLVRITWIVFVMGGRWPYSWCLVGCCRQDLFNIARNSLASLPSNFFPTPLYLFFLSTFTCCGVFFACLFNLIFYPGFVCLFGLLRRTKISSQTSFALA